MSPPMELTEPKILTPPLRPSDVGGGRMPRARAQPPRLFSLQLVAHEAGDWAGDTPQDRRGEGADQALVAPGTSPTSPSTSLAITPSSASLPLAASCFSAASFASASGRASAGVPLTASISG